VNNSRELRCRSRKHGELGPGWIEFRCASVFCGSKPGVVVIHRFYFDRPGEPETSKYKDPGGKT
jgi:hypothetical protein